MNRVLIVEDHAVVRTGLNRLLQAIPDVVIEEASTGETALAHLARSHFDFAILDLNLPGLGGLEVLRRIVSHAPHCRVLVLSMHSEPVYAAHCLKAGATGYVSKNAAPSELSDAIEATLAGNNYVERDIAKELQKQRETCESFMRPLSKRELEILRGLAAGQSLSEIAATLGIAYKTVANTCTHAKEKLGAASIADLVRIAVRGDLD